MTPQQQAHATLMQILPVRTHLRADRTRNVEADLRRAEVMNKAIDGRRRNTWIEPEPKPE